MRGELARLEAALARMEGRRETMLARLDALRQEIALAKGRLALKAEVEAFIEEAHGSASRRNMATFETLLTALVQEVLPGEKPVALELSTERGLAALDICVVRPDGTVEDVLEDNGGALTNVIGMALRLIAVVKADAGRFLALDEADCWIAPERVPSFYRVLEDAAARLGIQCLAVSHHDLSTFEGKFHVSRVIGDPAEGVGIASPDRDAEWDDEKKGLRFIRLVNVQAYSDATLHLSPGINALIGPNNRGKSTFVRALRAVFYGEARDSLVRSGAKAALVEIGVQGNRILRFSRQPRRSPVNVWSLHEADGSVVMEQGTRFETGGRAVPDWVEALCRIVKVEELDVHIAHQKFPVFLLGETPSRRSAVLSIGQEASYIRDMLALHRERCLRDNTFVRTGERELIEIESALRDFEDIEGLRESVARARAKLSDVEAASSRLQELEDLAERLGGLREAVRRARERKIATVDLPDPARLAALREALDLARERRQIALDLRETSAALAQARARQAVLEPLPSALPILERSTEVEETLASLVALRQARVAAEQRLSRSTAGLDAVRADMARLVEDTQGQCPTCGSAVDAEGLLDRHSHINPSVAA
jgi:hypothetical protein